MSRAARYGSQLMSRKTASFKDSEFRKSNLESVSDFQTNVGELRASQRHLPVGSALELVGLEMAVPPSNQSGGSTLRKNRFLVINEPWSLRWYGNRIKSCPRPQILNFAISQVCFRRRRLLGPHAALDGRRFSMDAVLALGVFCNCSHRRVPVCISHFSICSCKGVEGRCFRVGLGTLARW